MEFEEWFDNYTPDSKEREHCQDAWHDGRREGYKQALEEAAKAAKVANSYIRNQFCGALAENIENEIRNLKTKE